ncbi:MAG: ABC transporter ATP-binding protein [candidate division Zixibacteria bacterium]|nr:ABC transporter ATP-binding protein [candidate division Zixibacteria bacterium]MBU1470667.1 ABC transporter ATP-binding protein [candidate division Zixibacteria bacterium]MBU2626691.1 ABC transporter ATP-binding protein [candidate division Zixibacteria bacterium]
MNAESKKAIVEIEGVGFSYGGPAVLEDVNISLMEGEFTSVVGPNGGGKTTLLKLILGLLKPTEGRIRVFGRSPREERRRIGYMPQDTQLDPKFPINVRDVVLMGCIGNGGRFGRSGKCNLETAATALSDVGMVEQIDRPFASLSGGQRRRVLIARALACDPDLLLLDEPMVNLDLLMEQELYEILRKLSSKITVVMVSHDLAFVSKFVEKVVCVNRTVAAHATAAIDGNVFSQMYGQDIKMVLHDRHLRDED